MGPESTINTVMAAPGVTSIAPWILSAGMRLKNDQPWIIPKNARYAAFAK